MSGSERAVDGDAAGDAAVGWPMHAAAGAVGLGRAWAPMLRRRRSAGPRSRRVAVAMTRRFSAICVASRSCRRAQARRARPAPRLAAAGPGAAPSGQSPHSPAPAASFRRSASPASAMRPARSRVVSWFITSTSAARATSARRQSSSAGRLSRAARRSAAAVIDRLPWSRWCSGCWRLPAWRCRSGSSCSAMPEAAVLRPCSSASCSACMPRQVSSPKPPPMALSSVLMRGEHFLDQRVEEDALEFLGLLAELVDTGGQSGSARLAEPVMEAHHHSTSISACSAPVALIAWRMAIRSRGLMPRALRPSTSSCSVTDSWTTARCGLGGVDIEVGARLDRGLRPG